MGALLLAVCIAGALFYVYRNADKGRGCSRCGACHVKNGDYTACPMRFPDRNTHGVEKTSSPEQKKDAP